MKIPKCFNCFSYREDAILSLKLLLTKFEGAQLKKYKYKSYGSCILHLILMLVNICMKYSWKYLERFLSYRATWTYPKIYYFQFQRAITPKMCNPELSFMHSACRLMLLYICVKFHENISNGFWVKERTPFCDRQTAWAKTIHVCLPILQGET